MKLIYFLNPRLSVLQACDNVGVQAVAVVDNETNKRELSEENNIRIIEIADCCNPIKIIEALRLDGVDFGDQQKICVGLGDLLSEVSTLVNEALKIGADLYAKYESLELMRDKPALRKLIATQYPDYSGRYEIADNAETVLALLRESPTGIVVKPLDGSGF